MWNGLARRKARRRVESIQTQAWHQLERHDALTCARRPRCVLAYAEAYEDLRRGVAIKQGNLNIKQPRYGCGSSDVGTKCECGGVALKLDEKISGTHNWVASCGTERRNSWPSPPLTGAAP